MEDYNWPNCLCPANTPHLLKGDPWGFLLLSRSQRSPVLPLSRYDGCARLWPSPLACVFLTKPWICLPRQDNSQWYNNGAQSTHKVNINLLIFNINSAAVQYGTILKVVWDVRPNSLVVSFSFFFFFVFTGCQERTAETFRVTADLL